MHVGYGAGFQHLGGYSDRQYMHEEIGNCVQAEERGFESVWVTEHHFDDYSISPDPCQILSYIAGKTKRVKIGSMVIVVPWHDPVRLAEQISLLDHVSDGRFILGFGRGLARREFEGLRIDQNEGRQRFDEYAKLVLDALETGFIEGGETVKQPRREIRPRPFKSFKGRSFAAAASQDSVPVVAKLGLGMLVIIQKAWKLVTADLERYHALWKQYHPNAEPPKPFCSGFVFVDESTDRAEELARKYLAANYSTALEHYEMLGKHFNSIKGYERYADMSKYLNEIGQAKAVEDSAAGARKIRRLQAAHRHAGRNAEPEFRGHAARGSAAQHRLLREARPAGAEELAVCDARGAQRAGIRGSVTELKFG